MSGTVIPSRRGFLSRSWPAHMGSWAVLGSFPRATRTPRDEFWFLRAPPRLQRNAWDVSSAKVRAAFVAPAAHGSRAPFWPSPHQAAAFIFRKLLAHPHGVWSPVNKERPDAMTFTQGLCHARRAFPRWTLPRFKNHLLSREPTRSGSDRNQTANDQSGGDPF
jgi:hypothetical protein